MQEHLGKKKEKKKRKEKENFKLFSFVPNVKKKVLTPSLPISLTGGDTSTVSKEKEGGVKDNKEGNKEEGDLELLVSRTFQPFFPLLLLLSSVFFLSSFCLLSVFFYLLLSFFYLSLASFFRSHCVLALLFF